MNYRLHRLTPVLLAGLPLASLLATPSYAAPADSLSRGFQTPPATAKPQTWWHWMNGNVTREGITADLEAMKRVGLGGVTMFSVNQDIPAGKVRTLSPEWYEMVKFAVSEADRLGLDFNMHNCPGWSNSGGPWVTPEKSMLKITTSETAVTGGTRFDAALAQPTTIRGFYRDIAVLAYPSLKADYRIPAYRAKAGYEASNNTDPATGPDAPAGSVIDPSKMIVLTSKYRDGKLAWDVPFGDWTVMRVGYTPTGVTNHPAPPEATGLEIDKLSKSALDAHWNSIIQPLLDTLGPLAGKSLKGILIDSYEVGGQNWTPGFADEFKKRRGYDITPYFPVFTGRVVGNTAISERFLWDLRRTIADMMDENYYAHFSELCHQHGLQSLGEPYSNGPFEELSAGGGVDVPMGEFWAGRSDTSSAKLAASVGHVYGKPIIGAESFTARADNGKWTNDPFSLKALGDRAFCQGINRYIFHRYAMQPWLNRFPGMTMGKYGIHFERTNTLWDPQVAWLQYIQRSQYLLQQGHFVADALAFTSDNSDSLTFTKYAPLLVKTNPALPAGYDYDVCSSDGLTKHLKVLNGQILTPSGTSYRVLILPPNQTMQPATLRTIRDLVAAGATIYGAPPKRSPSLQNYPTCDDELHALATQLWGDCDGKTVTVHSYGKGKVIWGQPLAQVLSELKTSPDFATANAVGGLSYTHRQTDNADIYFVSNQTLLARDLQCSFRVTGKVPELWSPDTGKIMDAPVYRSNGNSTSIPIHFDPSGSIFVVFRRAVSGKHLTAVEQGDAKQPAKSLTIVKAIYEGVNGGGSVDVTAKIKALVKDNSLSLTPNNDLFGDPAKDHRKQMHLDYIWGGEAKSVVVIENRQFDLPFDAEGVPYPDYEWTSDAKDNASVIAWRKSSVQVEDSAGKTRTVSLPVVPAPALVTGPWTLNFPPNWGAPAQVTLDKLISWTDHENSGVKYFSGTATYIKNIDIPASALGAKKLVSLDLGRVKNIAQVRVNGKDMGTLWKPPFRVDLTKALHVGSNQLEVQVTNLWPNRLIGDEQLPPDVEWNGPSLKAWPQWLLDGKPSPTGRYTFTTWHHWTKDSPLFESGLLGPVTINYGVEVKP